MTRFAGSLGEAARVLLGRFEDFHSMLDAFDAGRPGASDTRLALERATRQALACQSELQGLIWQLEQRRLACSESIDATAGRSILVAEDNPANLALLKHQLRALGWHAVCASNGKDAWQQWQQGRFALLLVDKNMPGMDGYELTRAIRAAEEGVARRVPIIGITAGKYRDEIDAALAAGMDDLLPKPIEIDDLEAMLLRWQPETAGKQEPVPPDGEVAAIDLGYIERTIGAVSAGQRDALIALFIETTQAELLSAYEAGDNPQILRDSMHKMKSAARMVGALRFAMFAEALEAKAKREKSAQTLMPDLAKLSMLLQEVEEMAGRLGIGAVELDPLLSLSTGLMSGNVCVIDTNAVSLRQIKLMLQAHGWGNVLACASGEAALPAAQKLDEIDLLICDLDLPQMDAVELLHHFRERGYNCGVILLGDDNEVLASQTATLLLSMGFAIWGCLSKPVVHADLAAILQGNAVLQAGAAYSDRQPLTRTDLLAGIHDEEFEIHYQPKVDTRTLKVVGVEALARWHHAGRSISPHAFIVAAEEHNLIAPLSELLVYQALAGVAELAEAGIHLPITINLSSKWFHVARLPEFILACAKATGVDTGAVMLELSEAQIFGDLQVLQESLRQLHARGFHLSIDDADEHSSARLDTVSHLPFSEIKLGRRLLEGAESSQSGRSLLSSCIALAHQTGLSLVAEGVETQSELDLMRDLGCDHVQGWLIAKAMSIEELIHWLKGHGYE